jgi:hypothetical protein
MRDKSSTGEVGRSRSFCPTRRSFLGMAAALPLAWAASGRLGASPVAIPVALQLYSVRRDCQKDFDEALEQVAAIGFEGVEFAGYYNYAGRAAELRKRLDALGLKAAGTHIGLDTMLGDALAGTIDFHQAIGCRFLIVPATLPSRIPKRARHWQNRSTGLPKH